MHPPATGKRRAAAANSRAHPARLDRAEFEALYRRWRSALWCIAAGVYGDRSYAEDIVQEAVLIAYERRDNFTPGTSFLAWAGQIVRNIALNARRKRSEQNMSANDAEMLVRTQHNGFPADAGSTPLTRQGELKPEQQDFDDCVLASLMQLSPEARACLLLRTVVELSYAEISEALNIREGTAMSHVYRARRQMRTLVLRNDENNCHRSTPKP